MAAGPMELAAALDEMLELSEGQLAAFRDARMDDLFASQERREALYGLIKGAPDSLWDGRARALARRISENDRTLALLTEELMGEIRARLRKIDGGRQALKAYGACGAGNGAG